MYYKLIIFILIKGVSGNTLGISSGSNTGFPQHPRLYQPFINNHPSSYINYNNNHKQQPSHQLHQRNNGVLPNQRNNGSVLPNQRKPHGPFVTHVTIREQTAGPKV